jgi:hypothetical protein
MFFVSALLYAFYPSNLPIADTVKQAALIVASLGLSAIFLPELSSSLWDLKPAEVSALVPEEKVEKLQRSLIESKIRDPQWAAQILDGAIEPLVKTARNPHEVLFSVVYTVKVHVNYATLEGPHSTALSLVESSLEATRRLPQRARADVFWVALARDSASLRQEYLEPGCVYREVSDLDPSHTDEQWREAMLSRCSARVVIDGVSIEAVLEPPYSELESKNSRVLRWFFVSADLAKAVDDPYRIQICFDHVTTAEDGSFQAAFAAYYIAHGLSFTLSVYPPEAQRYDLEYVSFLGQALPPVVDESVNRKAVGQELRVVTRESSLIWPGSGLYVWWKPVNPE